MHGIEEEANLIYADLLAQKLTGTSGDVSLADIVAELQEKGYEIEQVAASGSTITGISLDSSSISVSANGTATITVNYEGSSDGNSYYAVVKGEYYKITETANGITIDRTPSEVDGSGSSGTLAATVTSGDSVTIGEISGNQITINGGSTAGSSVVTVTYGDYTATCTVAVVVTPTDSSVADTSTTFSTNYGTIDVIWLSGTSNTVTTIPNEPILQDENGEAMTPVTWTYDEGSQTWTEDSTAQSTWYSYNAVSTREEDGTTTDNLTSQWANAKTKNGSYFVWIPRYAYRITYYESETSTEPTGYYDGWGMWKAEDGSLKYGLDEGVETVEYKGNKYIVHPAFCDNVNLGGWDEDLSGFWFAKYEMSGSGSTTSSSDTLKSVPNVQSLRSTSIGNQYRYARNANYGYTGTEEKITSGGTEYTHTSYMSSHLVKNSEWGAVAYLTQSQYGRNGNEIDINNSSTYITGNGGGAVGGSASTASGTTNAYNTETGAKASTTGNVYGIYDMSGGAWEYVASFDKLGNSSYVAGSSYGLYMTQEAKDGDGNYISTKYATAYSNGTSSYSGNALLYTAGKVGDATKEVYLGNGSINWFSDYSDFVDSSFPFFHRGGCYYNGSPAGVFCSNIIYGSSGSDLGFRAALCP